MSIELAVADALGIEVGSTQALGGGDVAASYCVVLADGSRVFAKTKAGASPEFFDTEARSLSWLREAGALPVPEVLAVGENEPLLVLEWIDEARSRPDDVAFARSLAALHRAGAPVFGREDRRPTGSRGLPNDPCDTWAEFYATRRLLPLARIATDEQALPANTVAGIEAIAGRLETFGAADEPAARLHGDLWAGNRIVDRDGTSWIIDAAAHGGHREYDLAMMQLFGGWRPETFMAYDQVFPLADDWQSRVSLHQIAPLAVHAIKFGGSYAAATSDAVQQYL